MISVDRVCKSFQSGRSELTVLSEISFQIPKGQLLAIMGPSGSGKSTLLQILGGIEPPSSGQVLIDNQDLAQLNDLELTLLRRRKIGFVFQAFNLIPTLDVLNNVALPLLLDSVPHAEAITRSREAIEQVGMTKRIDHFPSQISGGEEQRVAIARALVIRPKLVLADEPTGNLDSKRGSEIIQLVSDLSRNEQLAVVVVTHDFRVASRSDRLMVLFDGKQCYDGPPDRKAVALLEEGTL